MEKNEKAKLNYQNSKLKASNIDEQKLSRISNQYNIKSSASNKDEMKLGKHRQLSKVNKF